MFAQGDLFSRGTGIDLVRKVVGSAGAQVVEPTRDHHLHTGPGEGGR